MKKISTVVFALVVASVLAMACSKKNADTTPKTDTTEAPATTGGDMYGGAPATGGAAYGG
jgi:hypothetical protein